MRVRLNVAWTPDPVLGGPRTTSVLPGFVPQYEYPVSRTYIHARASKCSCLGSQLPQVLPRVLEA